MFSDGFDNNVIMKKRNVRKDGSGMIGLGKEWVSNEVFLYP